MPPCTGGFDSAETVARLGRRCLACAGCSVAAGLAHRGAGFATGRDGIAIATARARFDVELARPRRRAWTAVSWSAWRERFSVRASSYIAMFLSSDQLGALGFDRFGILGDISVGSPCGPG